MGSNRKLHYDEEEEDEIICGKQWSNSSDDNIISSNRYISIDITVRPR